MTRSETQQFFDRRIAAWRRRDVDALTSDHAEHCVLESPIAGEVRGLPAIEKVYRGFLESFPDFAMDDVELVIDDARVVQIATMSGTNTGGFMGLPPTGKHFKFPVVAVYTFENGLIVHERRIYDFTGMLTQIGVLKAKPA
jgi:steroid delta-isomerase-like uncharacterized protein